MSPIQTASGGLWTGVDDSNDPEDDSPNILTGALNGYLPDPTNGCGFYSRPGCSRNNVLPVSSGQGQGAYVHVGLDGTVYNFLFSNGRVYRQNVDLVSAPTDVTPQNVPIASGTSSIPANVTSGRMVFCASLGDQLIVNDGVNTPWLGTNLSGTPITATPINLRSATNVLSRGSTDTNLANATFTYALFSNGSAIQYTQAASVAGTALGALGTIPASKWGIFLVYISTSSPGTIVFRSGAANFTTGYNTEAAAIAALPTWMAGTEWFVGYVTVLASASTWRTGTDAFAGGASGNPATTTNYTAGTSSPWVAFGRPVIHVGAAVFVLRVDGVTAIPTEIVWSEPNQPNTGYLQTNFQNFLNLIQTGSTPVYCLQPSNLALYYSRDLSWGALRGPPNQFNNNTTQDAISANVGCVAPATVQGFGNYVYFSDTSGRTNRFALGSTSGVEPLWLQARAAYDTATNAGMTTEFGVQNYTWALIEPNLNLYIVASFPTTTTNFAPNSFNVFEAKSGKYCGAWTVGGGVSMNVAGLLRDANNQPAMIWLQAPDVSANGYVWKLNRAAANIWQDNSATVPVSVNSARMAYSAQYTANVSAVRVLSNSVTPESLTTVTSVASVSQGNQTPPASADGTYRAVWTTDASSTNGRGVICVVGPTTTTSQWQCYRVEMDYTQELASAGAP